DGQPHTYLGGQLARGGGVSSQDPSPAFPFGHGIGYSTFEWTPVVASATTIPADGAVTLAFSVSNTSDRSGADVVQLYLSDPVASVVRPERRLIGFCRIELAAGARADVTVDVPMDLAAFTRRPGLK